ncbi:hypothetical protein [Celeribacter litoreus]|uniref:hypothetical protein n=1 Tax=Celeribacter litoreus TaxID=2876714 RepID=UPI001CCB5E4D|nr:hypothetical protein [Celeribacter litoreus]MCA0043117.1 hypothetical protein [Celeribacter litoreus]
MTDATFAANLATDSHDHSHSEEGVASTGAVVLFLLFVVAVLGGLGYAAFAIGPWVIGVTAVALVPFIFVALILLTVGR